MPQVNKAAVAAAFGRAAGHYQQHNALQRESAATLLAALPVRPFARVLDAGCGPGSMSRFWRSTGSHVTALDLSAKMLEQASRQQAAHQYIEADIEALPFSDAEFDLVWSNLAIQWCGSFRKAVSELYRVVRPGGHLAFTTLVAGSLPELNLAWRAVDEQPHVNRFLSSANIQQVLEDYHSQQQVESITLTFDDALSAMRSLKGTGATHLHQGRAAQTLTRGRLQQLQLAWPKQQGRCALTYHLFSGVIYRD